MLNLAISAAVLCSTWVAALYLMYRHACASAPDPAAAEGSGSGSGTMSVSLWVLVLVVFGVFPSYISPHPAFLAYGWIGIMRVLALLFAQHTQPQPTKQPDTSTGTSTSTSTFSSFLSAFLTFRPNWRLSDSEWAQLPSIPARVGWFAVRFVMFHGLTPILQQWSYLSYVSAPWSARCLLSYFMGFLALLMLELESETLCLGYYFVAGGRIRPFFPISRSFPLLAPARTTSVRDLWGTQWHQVLRQTMKQISYDPMKSFLARHGAPLVMTRSLPILSVFVVSGVLHQLVATVFVHDTTLWHFLFFLVQGLGVVAQGLVAQYAPGVTRSLPPWLCMVLTHMWLLLTTPLFTEAFLRAELHRG